MAPFDPFSSPALSQSAPDSATPNTQIAPTSAVVPTPAQIEASFFELFARDTATWAEAQLARNICIALSRINVATPIPNAAADIHDAYPIDGPLEDPETLPHFDAIDPAVRWYAVVKGKGTAVVQGYENARALATITGEIKRFKTERHAQAFYNELHATKGLYLL